MGLPIRFIFTWVTAALITGCATLQVAGPQLGVNKVASASLLTASPLADGADLPDPSGTNILEMTPEMVSFLDDKIAGRAMENVKLRKLLSLLVINGQFERRGNCLSFTNLFVAQARHIGLHAYYQEVEVPPDWSRKGDALLLSQHVNVFVDMKQYTDRVVDFNTDVIHYYVHDLKENYERRVITDQRARAHYFNNVGVERMLSGGDTLTVLADLQQSIREDDTFAPAWINIGILHRRDGYPEYAEAAYLRALLADPTSFVAMSNLASLYEEHGLADNAEFYRSQVKRHRMNNPYYRYQLAQEAVVGGDYRTAIEHLKFAVHNRESEHRFQFLLGASYLLSGDRDEAKRWFASAQALADNQEDARKYRQKMSWMMPEDVEP
jgi:tetratricopeptide (TPR) repeat protein